MLAILFAIWVPNVSWPRYPTATIAMIGLLFVTNLVGIYIVNRNPIFAERALAEFLVKTDEEVHTDPVTVRRGSFLFQAPGVGDRVFAAEPKAVVLFFANPKYVVEGRQLTRKKALKKERLNELAAYRPKDDWTVIWEKKEDRKFIGFILEYLGLKKAIPAEIYRRLNNPNPPVILYRP